MSTELDGQTPSNVVDLAKARELRRERQGALTVHTSAIAGYRARMAQLRGLRKIHGFDSDSRLMGLLKPVYACLLADAEQLAPSPAIFARDLGIASRCKAS